VQTLRDIVLSFLLVVLELAIVVVIVAPKATARAGRRVLSAIAGNLRAPLAFLRGHAPDSRRRVESSAEGN
jgi:hypothetical protein